MKKKGIYRPGGMLYCAFYITSIKLVFAAFYIWVNFVLGGVGKSENKQELFGQTFQSDSEGYLGHRKASYEQVINIFLKFFW